MKKFLIALLAVVMLLQCGCGTTTETESEISSDTETETEGRFVYEPPVKPKDEPKEETKKYPDGLDVLLANENPTAFTTKLKYTSNTINPWGYAMECVNSFLARWDDIVASTGTDEAVTPISNNPKEYTLKLMEAKNCVGYDWFQYWDNDPENLNVDLSNRNSNKGIYSIHHKEYTDLTDQMKELNFNKYTLIKFFDER